MACLIVLTTTFYNRLPDCFVTCKIYTRPVNPAEMSKIIIQRLETACHILASLYYQKKTNDEKNS
jgi:hypothetical protein